MSSSKKSSSEKILSARASLKRGWVIFRDLSRVSFLEHFDFLFRKKKTNFFASKMEELPRENSSTNLLPENVANMLEGTMNKASKTLFGNIETKKSYHIYDNTLSSLPVNKSQSSLSLQVSFYRISTFFLIISVNIWQTCYFWALE